MNFYEEESDYMN